VSAPSSTKNISVKDTHPQSQNQNPFGLSFVIPTQFVELPSGGNYYPDSSPLKGVDKIEIRHMTAKEEDILANQDYILQGVVFDKLIDSILIDRRISSRDFLSGDKNAILVAARATGYGSDYAMSLPCSKCSQVADFIFDLEKMLASPLEMEEGVQYMSERNLFQFTLPKSEVTIGIRLLTGIDEEYFDQQKKRHEKLGLETNTTIEFLRKVIVEADGIEDRSLLNQLIEVLPAIDSRKVRAVHNRVMPQIDTTQTVTCPKCNGESESEVPFTLGFFWPDI